MNSVREIQRKVLLSTCILDAFSLATHSSHGTTPEEKLNVIFHQLAKNIAGQTKRSTHLERTMLQYVVSTQSKCPRAERTRELIADLTWSFLWPHIPSLEKLLAVMPISHFEDLDTVAGSLDAFMANIIEFDLSNWALLQCGLREFIIKKILEMLQIISIHDNLLIDLRCQFFNRLIEFGYSFDYLVFLSDYMHKPIFTDYLGPQFDLENRDRPEFKALIAKLITPQSISRLESSIENLPPGTNLMQQVVQPNFLHAIFRVLQMGAMRKS